MMSFLKKLMLGLSFLAAGSLALADDHGTKEEAKTMVDAAVAHVGKVGWDKAKVDFMDKNNTAWRTKDLYVFAIDNDGVNRVHGGNEKMVGKDIMHLKDSTGREYIKEMVTVASSKGSGWVDYAWQNPNSKKVEDKSSYVRKLPSGDMLVGVGFYK